jgi:F420-non-reducing hydrogenase iron-sulfur subunit
VTDVKLLTFVCNWCSYGGADNAGGRKLVYPAGVRVVRVMCSGRVDAQHVLEGFRNGADGVLVLGCHPGDCHYKEGNYKALNRAVLLESLLVEFGVEPERFRLDWVSATQGDRFRDIVTQMYEAVAKLGKLRLPEQAVPGVRP